MIEVIINAGSGEPSEKEAISQQVERWFAERQCAARVGLAKNGDELQTLIERAVASDAPILVAGGGDGTLNGVAAAALSAGKIFGVLPLGTLNHFAKDLGIPLDLREAVNTICAGQTTLVDVAEVNGRIFLNNSSLGLYPDLVHQRETLQEKEGYRKWPAFVRALLTTWQRYKMLSVVVKTHTQTLARHTPFVFIGNNEYLLEAGANFGGRHTLQDGKLCVYVSHGLSRAELLMVLLRAIFGGVPKGQRDFQMLRLDEVTIRTRQRRMRVAFDGEVEWMATPLHYRTRPAALRVCVPERTEQENSNTSR